MTTPYMMNCPHKSDSWCITCVSSLGEDHRQLRARTMEVLEGILEAESPGDMYELAKGTLKVLKSS
jgi:hypothetical protein